MPLDHALRLLFDQAHSFNVSVELVQKLGQQLRFDTFVDENAHTLENSSGKFKRLSIGGSRILIDIDHTSDVVVLKVSLLASANSEADKQDYVVSRLDDGDTKVITLDFAHNPYLVIAIGSEGADQILFRNLQNQKLGKFPENLRLLAQLDRLSSKVDLFAYINNVALVLHTIHQIELESKDEWTPLGFGAVVGRPYVNSPERGEIGVFLDFWQDQRYVARELGETSFYTAKFFVEENTREVDYLDELRFKPWLMDGKKYRIDFQEGTHTGTPGTAEGPALNWGLNLLFNKPVPLPKLLLKALGISKYTTADLPPEHALVQDGGEFTIEGPTGPTSFSHKVHFPHDVVVVQLLQLEDLVDLQKLIPIVRNYLVYSSILRLVLAVKTSDKVSVTSKLKESLKLSDDVTEEELIALNTITEHKTENVDEFMKDDSREESTGIALLLDETNYASPFSGLKFSLNNHNFIIANGVVSGGPLGNALDVTEDLVESLRAVHS